MISRCSIKVSRRHFDFYVDIEVSALEISYLIHSAQSLTYLCSWLKPPLCGHGVYYLGLDLGRRKRRMITNRTV
jgi:hypothetical protein